MNKIKILDPAYKKLLKKSEIPTFALRNFQTTP